ncbi:MAG: response regulator [Leptospirales bacterium]|nr:response regulator [Leptospirales bacterium]
MADGVKTILIIDDDKVIRDLARLILEKHNYRVIDEADSASAFKTIEAHRPDLILLDVHLDKEDGLIVLTRLKSNPLLKGVPVIMLTADAGRDLVARAARGGAVDYVVKPFQQAQLIGRIVRALQIGDLERSRESGSAARVELERKGGITRLVFTGRVDSSLMDRLREVFTHTLRMQARNDEVVIDLRFQNIQGEAHLNILRGILDLMKPITPRIIAGRNFAQLLQIDTAENQLFLSPDDLIQWIQFRESGKKRA